MLVIKQLGLAKNKKKKKHSAVLKHERGESRLGLSETMNETEQGQLIPQRLRLTNRVDAARRRVCDLAEQPRKAKVTTLPLDNFSLAACVK